MLALDLFVGGEIEAISLHRVHVWAVPEERADVICEACGHSDTCSAVLASARDVQHGIGSVGLLFQFLNGLLRRQNQ